MTNANATLMSLIEDCILSARQQGWTGRYETYQLTPADCEWIVKELGRKPTREEWTDAGYRGAEDAHVAD